MFRNKFYLLIIALSIISLALYSCENKYSDSVQTQPPTGDSPVTYSSNPYNWAGQLHNDGLSYIISNYQPDTLSGNFPDTQLSDSVAYYGSQFSQYHSGYTPVSSEYLKTSTVLHYAYSPFVKVDSLIYDKINYLISNNKLSTLDSFYALKIYNLVHSSFVNQNYSLIALKDSIISIENSMLSETWSSDDGFAFFSIAILKYTVQYNIDNYSSFNLKGNNIQHMTDAEKFAFAMVDYGVAVVAIGIFLSSGPLTGIIAIKAASIAYTASGAVAQFGEFFNLW